MKMRRNRHKVEVDAEERRRLREDNSMKTCKSKSQKSLLKKHQEGFQTTAVFHFSSVRNQEQAPALGLRGLKHMKRLKYIAPLRRKIDFSKFCEDRLLGILPMKTNSTKSTA